MRHSISRPHAPACMILLILALISVATTVQAKDVPSDACVLLPAAQVARVLGQPISDPTRTAAPPAFSDEVSGTDCTYQSREGTSREILFRIYMDATPEVSKKTFEKLSILAGGAFSLEMPVGCGNKASRF
jgi:hypothetical protein